MSATDDDASESPHARKWMALYAASSVLAFVRGAWFVLASVAAEPGPTTRFAALFSEHPILVPINLLGAPIVLALVIGIQALNPFSARVWQWPSWRRFPFSRRQPFQFFHLSGWVALAAGLGMLCALPFAPGSSWPFGAYVAVSGVGILIGLRTTARLFASRMARRQ